MDMLLRLYKLSYYYYYWNRRETDHYTAIRWLVHWPLMGGLIHLVQRQQRGGEWLGCMPPRPLLVVPNVHYPSTASVPTSYYSMWHY